MAMIKLPGLPIPLLPAALPPPSEVAKSISRVLVRGAGMAPFALQREVVTRVMEQALKEPLEDGDFAFLGGKWLEVCISDAGLRWYFSYGSDGRLVLRNRAEPDVTIRGKLKEFVLLAAREEDPDTLFFQRRLVIEGDTELGLAVKNLMDGVDHDGLPPLLRLALGRAAGLVRTLL
jgi:predicted lipid carrier protein YhbT